MLRPQAAALLLPGDRLLVACLPSAYLASHDILETAGCTLVEARVPYMEGWSASGLTAYFGMSA